MVVHPDRIEVESVSKYSCAALTGDHLASSTPVRDRPPRTGSGDLVCLAVGGHASTGRAACAPNIILSRQIQSHSASSLLKALARARELVRMDRNPRSFGVEERLQKTEPSTSGTSNPLLDPLDPVPSFLKVRSRRSVREWLPKKLGGSSPDRGEKGATSKTSKTRLNTGPTN